MSLINCERSQGVQILTPAQTYQSFESELLEDPRYFFAQTMNFGHCRSTDEFLRILASIKGADKKRRELRIDAGMVNRPFPETPIGRPVSKRFCESFDPKDLREDFRPNMEAVFESNTDLLLTNPPRFWQRYTPTLERDHRKALYNGQTYYKPDWNIRMAFKALGFTLAFSDREHISALEGQSEYGRFLNSDGRSWDTRPKTDQEVTVGDYTFLFSRGTPGKSIILDEYACPAASQEGLGVFFTQLPIDGNFRTTLFKRALGGEPTLVVASKRTRPKYVTKDFYFPAARDMFQAARKIPNFAVLYSDIPVHTKFFLVLNHLSGMALFSSDNLHPGGTWGATTEDGTFTTNQGFIDQAKERVLRPLINSDGSLRGEYIDNGSGLVYGRFLDHLQSEVAV